MLLQGLYQFSACHGNNAAEHTGCPVYQTDLPAVSPVADLFFRLVADILITEFWHLREKLFMDIQESGQEGNVVVQSGQTPDPVYQTRHGRFIPAPDRVHFFGGFFHRIPIKFRMCPDLCGRKVGFIRHLLGCLQDFFCCGMDCGYLARRLLCIPADLLRKATDIFICQKIGGPAQAAFLRILHNRFRKAHDVIMFPQGLRHGLCDIPITFENTESCL